MSASHAGEQPLSTYENVIKTPWASARSFTVTSTNNFVFKARPNDIRCWFDPTSKDLDKRKIFGV